MIDFFEFLNTCSPLRAVAYMAFILLFVFMTYSFVDGIINRLFNRDCDCEDVEEEEVEDTRQQLND